MRRTDQRPRAASEPLLQHEAPALQLDALQMAKERQDKVHAALDVWIAEAIAELAAER
jgi:hypothetical protein